MKKLRSTILLLAFLPLLSTGQSQLQTGWYFLAEKPIDGVVVHDSGSENVFAVEKTPLLSIADFKTIEIVTRDFEPEPMQAIALHLTKDGRRKWDAAKKRIARTKESVVFVFNDKIYCEKYIYSGSKTLTSVIDLFIAAEDIQRVFSAIKAEM